jgi:serine/threonine-protein kinase HipA
MRLRIIYKEKQNAGTLWRDKDGYHFEYDDDFISDENTHPISVNMPKSQKRYDSTNLFPLFQSMLSEGFNRELQCNALGIEVTDDWSLLMHTCENDTIGAITVKREDI